MMLEKVESDVGSKLWLHQERCEMMERLEMISRVANHDHIDLWEWKVATIKELLSIPKYNEDGMITTEWMRWTAEVEQS